MTVRAKRAGTLFTDFARRAVEIITSHAWGADQDLFLFDYFDGNPPTDRQTRDFEWEEFKRARDYSNQMFNERKEGWVWMRARHGAAQGQFYYQAVARIVDGEPEIVIKYPVSETLLIDKTGDWLTRTQSQMRVKVANIKAKKKAALASNNSALMREAEAELDEIIVFAPRLAEIYFDTGLKVQDLRELAASSKVPRLLQKSVKRTLHTYEKSQEEIKNLSQLIYTIKEMRRRR